MNETTSSAHTAHCFCSTNTAGQPSCCQCGLVRVTLEQLSGEVGERPRPALPMKSANCSIGEHARCLFPDMCECMCHNQDAKRSPVRPSVTPEQLQAFIESLPLGSFINWQGSNSPDAWQSDAIAAERRYNVALKCAAFLRSRA